MKQFQKVMLAGMMIAMLVAGSSASAASGKHQKPELVGFAKQSSEPQAASGKHQKPELVGFAKHVNEYEGQHR